MNITHRPTFCYMLKSIMIEIKTHVNAYAPGSCLIKNGNTHLICIASFLDKTPAFLKKSNEGWVSAEYAMLPHATHSRSARESLTKPKGRSMEIKRLIARSLRAACHLPYLTNTAIILDCDVLQADGGTRTTAINGAFVALRLAIQNLLQRHLIEKNPIKHKLCAVSCAIHQERFIFDPTYEEDSSADADLNIVFTHSGQLIEIQGTGEKSTINIPSFDDFLQQAFQATEAVRTEQQKALAQLGIE